MWGSEQRAAQAYREQFGEEPVVLASAPGRVNLIGEHTDYNGGFVLPCAIDQRVAVALGPGGGHLYSADFDALCPLTPSPDEDTTAHSWAAYPRGIAWALREGGYPALSFRAAFAGNVPRGAGLSSSAAIEAATALALDTLLQTHIPRRELALLCQRAENVYVGVQSGIMDQYASLLCEAASALLIDCRTLDAQAVPLDLEGAGLTLLVCDTRVPRELAATAYNARRTACERAAHTLGVAQLRDATLDQLAVLTGEELLRARHIVTENGRVLASVDALHRGDMQTFGALMYQSHESLRDDYAVSTPELDAVVEVAAQVGALGARLTGAGFGGCAIMVIARDQAQELREQVRQRFASRSFVAPAFYEVHPAAGARVAD